MSEVLLIVVLFAAGWALVSSMGLRDWGAVPLGFIVGSFVAILAGGILGLAGLPTAPLVILAVTVVVSATTAIVRRWRPGRSELRLAALGLVVAFPLILLFRGANLVAYHIDSFRYLVASSMLASNNYHEASVNLLEKRGLSAPVVHSLASDYGEAYVRSHSPLLTIAMVAAIVWLLTHYADLRQRWWHWAPVVVAAALLFVTNNRMVFNAFYINDHLTFGAAFLVACGASWLLAARLTEHRDAMLLCLLLSLPVLVVTRAEGFIAAALAIAPFCLSPTVARRERVLALRVAGYGVLVWFGYIAVVTFARGGSTSLESLGPAALGVTFVAGASAIGLVDTERWGKPLLLAGEAALWLLLLAFIVRDPELLRRSLAATFENQIGGAGSWGLSLIALGVLGFLALVVGRSPALVYLRFPLTAFLPVFFLLAYLRDGAYRVGNGDSLNRMLMQIVPALILYVAAAAIPKGVDEPTQRERTEPVEAV